MDYDALGLAKLGDSVRQIWAHGASGKTVIILVAIILVVSGIGWVLFGWAFLKLTVLELIKEVKSMSWPETEGTVQSSGVEYMEGGVYGPAGKEGGDWYQTRLDYGYRVKGTWYASSEYIGGSFSERGAQRRISKYPPSTPVIVYYDPENPQVSSIKRGIWIGRILLMSLYSFLVLGAGAGLGILWLNVAGVL